MQKELAIVKNRKKNINLVCDQVNGWSTKVVNKLNKQILNDFGQNIDIREGSDGKGRMSMSEMFQNISQVVCGKLEEIIEQNDKRKKHDIAAGILKDDDQSEGGIVGDFQDHNFMDFATDEFIAKVIRVRPSSGIT